MDLEKQLILSYYEQVAILNNEHKIYLVQHRETQKIYVKKILDVYNKEVYMNMYKNPVAGTPCIKEVLELDEELIIIEEYVSGNTIEELLNYRKFDQSEIVDIICQLCVIVKNIHAVKPAIIHRDIKPSNIIIMSDGRVVLIDFNAAKYIDKEKEEDTKLLGTKGYAAPEQFGFGTSDIRTDIYALGMLMNTLSLGRFSTIVTDDKKLSKIINKCINMNPDKRYQKVDKLEKDLMSIKKVSHNIPKWGKYLPIGFRTFNKLHMEVAIIFYAMFLWVFSTVTFTGVSNIATIAIRFLLIISFLIDVLINGNYLDYQKYIPILNSKYWFVRIIGITFVDFIFLSTVFIIMCIIAVLF